MAIKSYKSKRLSKRLAKSKSSKSKSSKSKSFKSTKNMVLRVYTNNNGNEKYNYITKEEANKHMKPRHKRFDRFKKTKKTKKALSKRYTKHKGGFFGTSNCNIATVKERGFNLPSYGLGANQITGFSIPDTNAMIFNPNCASSPNQAMAP